MTRTHVAREGRSWPLGTADDVRWIVEGTRDTRNVNAAIPAVFAAYASVVNRDDELAGPAQDRRLVELLDQHSDPQPWWLGYLETGAHDIVFPDAPRTALYWDWPYVLVQAGPEQALSWRAWDAWRGAVPDVIFPADHSFLVSMLWDDDWRCLGGPVSLIDDVVGEPSFVAYRIAPGQDATPPGHASS